MQITNTEVYGFEASLRGMRNPMDSWHLQDSRYLYDYDLEELKTIGDELQWHPYIEDFTSGTFVIGDKDMDLAKRLIKAGNEHCKFLRQIQGKCVFFLKNIKNIFKIGGLREKMKKTSGVIR